MRQKSHESGDDDIKWNFILDYFKLVANSIRTVDDSSRSGDLILWYRSLKTFWRDIRDIIRIKQYKGKDTQFNELDKEIKGEFKDIANRLKPQTNISSSTRLTNQIKDIAITNVESALDDLNSRLMELLHDSEVIFPPGYKFNWLDEENETFPE